MASSAALHRVVCTWLLEGELYKNVPWMIGPDEIDKNESVMSIRSHVHFGSDSFLAKVKIVKELVPRSLQSSPSLINEVIYRTYN
jgi:hypothetical protein